MKKITRLLSAALCTVMLSGVVTVAPFSVNAAETENEIVAAEFNEDSIGSEQFESGIFKYSVTIQNTPQNNWSF